MVSMKKIILNQKSYLKYDEVIEFKKEFDKLKPKGYEFLLFPSIQYLSLFKDSKYLVGTQNFYSYKVGSFTGEVNIESLKDMGINYTMIGHFERRKIMGETYGIIKEKLYKSLSSKCNTILCIGEDNKLKKDKSFVKKELGYYLKSLESSSLKYLSICYLPSNALDEADKSVDRIARIVDFIRTYFSDKYKIDIEVYYGGNIENSNIKEIYDICDGIMLDTQSIDIKIIKELLKEI